MNKIKFSKTEKVFFTIAILILVALFISSSMTYHEQKMQPGFIHRHFAFLEDWLGNMQIYYAQKWHSAAIDGRPQFTEFIIRKFAHFITYFFLGISLYLATQPIYRIKWLAPIYTWLSVLGLASLDEYHQYLTGDRTPSVHDVMLDGTGALCGLVLVLIILGIIKLINHSKHSTKNSI